MPKVVKAKNQMATRLSVGWSDFEVKDGIVQNLKPDSPETKFFLDVGLVEIVDQAIPKLPKPLVEESPDEEGE